MSTPTWATIQAQFKTVIETALATHKTKVIARELLGLGDDPESKVDATLFRVQADNSRINALMFWRGNVEPDSDRRERWQIELRLYYQYASGTDAESSSTYYEAIVDALRDALRADARAATRSCDILKSGTFRLRSKVKQFGDVAAHYGTGAFTITVLPVAT